MLAQEAPLCLLIHSRMVEAESTSCEPAVEALLEACCSPSGSVSAWSGARATLKRKCSDAPDASSKEGATIDRILVGCVPTPRGEHFADEGGSISERSLQAHGKLGLAVTLSIECATLALGSVLSGECAYFVPVEESTKDQHRSTVVEEVHEDIEGFASVLLRACGYLTCCQLKVPWADSSTDDRARQLLQRAAARTRFDVAIVRYDTKLCAFFRVRSSSMQPVQVVRTPCDHLGHMCALCSGSGTSEGRVFPN